ncbi:MAG: transcriptional repressor LexA, partial [Geminicoccaceae bacterium]|nr:transcriptional repressor LexA [Geminicoccaceae bacterium]
QFQLLRYIHQFMQEHGVPPSFEEMRTALGLRSKSGIHRLISGLEERGYIRRLAYRARALEVVKAPLSPAPARLAVAKPAATAPEVRTTNVVHAEFGAPRRPGFLAGVAGNVDLPVYGRIAAGTPIEALADHGTTMDVPSVLLGEGEHYILQVVGDSMIEAGIQDGDWVVIRRAETAESGEIVVALIEDREVTLKRLRRRGASIALEAANPAHETRIFGPHQVKVQGKLVGLLRRY